MTDLLEVLHQIAMPRVLVVGDLLLDRYVWGDAERVSPEAPVLVLRSDRQEARLGGAASVAALLRGLDAEVALVGVVGDDASGRTVDRLLAEDRIDVTAVCLDRDRPTTTKERFIGRTATRSAVGGNQILRVDYEVRQPLACNLERQLIDAAEGCLSDCHAVLISDYNKGVCTQGLLSRLIEAAGKRNIPVLVDPARTADFKRYAGATVLVPNRAEAEWGTGRKIVTSDDALAAGRDLLTQCAVPTVVLKLDREGMILFRRDEVPLSFPTRPRDVCDVTGAGDMVLAMLGLCLSSSVELSTAVPLANAAAGVEVERLGVEPVSRSEVYAELDRLQGTLSHKLVAAERMATLAEQYRRRGKSIVFTNGCFDLLHVGHVSYLLEAAREADVLVVAINSDGSVSRLKGPDRPIVSQDNRAALLSALACVDHVVVFDDDTPHALLRQIRPDVLVKGGTYRVDEVAGREIVESYGGRVCVSGKVEGVSTTRILQSVQALGGEGRPSIWKSPGFDFCKSFFAVPNPPAIVARWC
jgi:D-beta-D-heptose 7-phosphate kinase / D-beta-D-heptose 1-phosphate adenosyltransferase